MCTHRALIFLEKADFKNALTAQSFLMVSSGCLLASLAPASYVRPQIPNVFKLQALSNTLLGPEPKPSSFLQERNENSMDDC